MHATKIQAIPMEKITSSHLVSHRWWVFPLEPPLKHSSRPAQHLCFQRTELRNVQMAMNLWYNCYVYMVFVLWRILLLWSRLKSVHVVSKELFIFRHGSDNHMSQGLHLCNLTSEKETETLFWGAILVLVGVCVLWVLISSENVWWWYLVTCRSLRVCVYCIQ